MGRKKNKKNGNKGPKMAPYRPEEEAYLLRWKGAKSAPSLFEKIDRDPVYEKALHTRIPLDDWGQPTGEVKMGTHWGVGKPKGPK